MCTCERFNDYLVIVITLKMAKKPQLSFAQMWNLSFGFFGVQIAYALQSANISRIFATLGADPHQLSFFWILPPLMGMIVQPFIGKWSDRTWCRMGRRKPYLLVGAIVAVIVMAFLPNAGSLHFSERLLLGLNGAMWFGLFSLIFLDTSINVAMQPFKMMVGDTVNEEQKTRAYSIQSLLCNAESLVGYLFPIFFTWRKTSTAVQQGRTVHFLRRDNSYAYFRIADGETVLVFVNNSPEEKEIPWGDYEEITVNLPSEARDVLTSETVKVGEKNVLGPRAAKIIEFK